MKKTIAVLEGDGIGPEIMAETIKVLNTIQNKYGHEFEFIFGDFGGMGYDKQGSPFPESTKEICDTSDTILKGPIGSPKYDSIPDLNLRPERGGVLALRKRYNTFANLRPVRLPKELLSFSPLKQSVLGKEIDLMIVRELIGGIYFGKKEQGQKENGERFALDTMEYTETQVKQIARIAFQEARKQKTVLHNIHKSNVLECSIFWNEIVNEIQEKEFPDVQVGHMLVDNVAFQLVVNPSQFKVMLMENMMGDILSDQCGGILGSLGLMPSACIGPKKAYYEPAHGSAPAIAGKNIANPYSMIGSAALMLEYSFGLKTEAEEIWNALFQIMHAGYQTPDLIHNSNEKQKQISTNEFGTMIQKTIEEKKETQNKEMEYRVLL
ncbi:MAG: 3-isopropylmalate dehydrogenase [Candidatus Diapherotrites archaeon]|nr:3-isopropylmalate dehydrogenase [Candidatus Diapherotrites archaeon]